MLKDFALKMVSHQNKVKVVYCGPGQFYHLANSIDFPKSVWYYYSQPTQNVLRLLLSFAYCYQISLAESALYCIYCTCTKGKTVAWTLEISKYTVEKCQTLCCLKYL